jgi:hypothetical protein
MQNVIKNNNLSLPCMVIDHVASISCQYSLNMKINFDSQVSVVNRTSKCSLALCLNCLKVDSC